MMIKKSNIWLLVVLSAMMLACKGNKGIQAVGTNGENATGLYDAQNAGRAEVQTAGATMRQTAKTVVMYEMPAPLKDRPEQILKRKGYTVSYNSETKNPNWVAWHLTKSHTYGSFQRREEVFSEDESVKAPRATNKAMTQSFLFTNICPQNHGLNKYEWNDLEIQCRDWAREYGAVDIVCGPLYSSKGGRYKVGSSHEPQQKTIGRNKVWVPDAFFKVVLCRQGRPKAIGFVYRNEGVKQLKTEAVRTVDEVEALTGIDFFPALDDDMENRIEASANLSDW